MSTKAKAQEAKEKGNAAFKAGNFPEAVGHYTDAMLADSSDPTFTLNRAAAYLKLGKHVDAERDCSTTLRLSPGHVKAFFRRAQARKELGKLKESKADLLDALKIEPGNTAIEAELDRVDQALSQSGKNKTAPLDVEKMKERFPPRRRRVPIEIVEPETSSDIQSQDMLTPISTRSLGATKNVLPSPQPSPPREPSPKVDSIPTQPRVRTTQTSVEGRGGIFRPSGEHTLFRLPQMSSSSPSSKLLSKTSGEEAPQPSPLSLVEFSHAWELTSASERWDLLCKIPPEALPSLFKTSLEATLLIQIFEVCSLAVKAADPIIEARVRDYLHWLQRVPRFSTVTMFLSKQERAIARTLADVVGLSGWII